MRLQSEKFFGESQNHQFLGFSIQYQFFREQKDLIAPLLAQVKPFRREANSRAHKVIEYLENIDEPSKLKIPEIVQLELYLIQKIKAEKKATS